MRNNTEEVKKNLLKKIKMILSIIMLSLIMVPCITSCIHGNNPNKPADEVEEEGGDPAAELVPSFTLEEKIIKALTISQINFFFIFKIIFAVFSFVF